MRIYPAIDLRKGKVVQLIGGDPAQVAVERPDVGEQAQTWKEAEAGWVHVVDLDAAFGEANQWAALPRILGRNLRVQFGGGVRSMVQVQQLLDLGVERVVVGTQGVRNPAWVRELCRIFPGRVVLAIDARGRDVAVSGWTEATGLDVVTFARSLDDAGLAAFLYTDIEREGLLSGIERDVVAELRRNTPHTELIVSGGVTSLDDLEWLAAAGVDGVVLGMSIYKGNLDLREAIRRFDPPGSRPMKGHPSRRPFVADATETDRAAHYGGFYEGEGTDEIGDRDGGPPHGYLEDEPDVGGYGESESGDVGDGKAETGEGGTKRPPGAGEPNAEDNP